MTFAAARFLIFACAAGVLAQRGAAESDLTRWVNPFVGTDGHGHTFPGATQPFGLVQASPDTRVLGWDACSGYHYSDTFIYGFSHTHLSGVGIPDYCDVLIAPQSVEPTIETPEPDKGRRGYGSHFSHAREHAEPGYYDVHLDDQNLDAQLTTTRRVALHRYTFPKSGCRSLVIDLEHRDLTLDAQLTVVSPTEIAGYRRSAAWAKNQVIYFVIRFEHPVTAVRLFSGGRSVNEAMLTGKKVKALVTLPAGAEQTVQFKVALSPVSIEGARRNLDAEMPSWDFASVRSAARAEWNQVLGKIVVEGRDPAQLRTFYTALYHAYLSPNTFSDVDGTYPGRDGKMHHADHGYYTVFSLWDTYRAWHPLMTLLEPTATRDFIRTFLLMYQQGGLLPVWDLAGNETFCMNGYHAVPVIADAYGKGIRGFDTEVALAAMKESATREHFGLGAYQAYGYVAREDGREGVSRTLEYAYDDWCIAQFAGWLGRSAERETYLRRSQNYRNLFSNEQHFFVGRENGGWYAPFNPREINFNYTEGNAWQYRFGAPQDILGLIDLFGGDAAFGSALDDLFNASSGTDGREQPDVSGLIGQYAQGNEPDHHVPYLYNFVGRPSETQRLVRKIMATMYSDRPDGLCGNEDCGQMSAWYLFSALGFYPVTPGSTQYVIGSPLFERASIDVGGGKKFVVVANNQSPTAVYIAAISLNGVPLERSFLNHAEIAAGGKLELTMSAQPNRTWATELAARPGERVPHAGMVTVPAISVPISFRDEATVSITGSLSSDTLWYTLDGTEPKPKTAQRYAGAFTLNHTAMIACVAEREGRLSSVVRAEAHHVNSGWRLKVNSPINPQYQASGPDALIDGVVGGPDFTTGRWQGYEDCALDLVLDLGRVTHVRAVRIGFLQDANSYIFYPPEVRFEISKDGVAFREIETVRSALLPRDTTKTTVQRVETRVSADGRYLRIHAPNAGPALAWGSATEMIKSFLFCDEIQIDRD